MFPVRILTTYNNTTHSTITIKIKAVDAVKKEHHLFMAWHLWDSAKRDRTYPKIEEGSFVRIEINQKKTAKGHDPTFSKEKYKIVAIKDGGYFIPSYHKHRLWSRHELLLV